MVRSFLLVFLTVLCIWLIGLSLFLAYKWDQERSNCAKPPVYLETEIEPKENLEALQSSERILCQLSLSMRDLLVQAEMELYKLEDWETLLLLEDLESELREFITSPECEKYLNKKPSLSAQGGEIQT